jgi:VanZ family protein
MGEGVNRKKAAIWAFFASVIYGISDEPHQMFTQGREARFRDVIIDGFGAGIIIYLIYKYLDKLPKKVRKCLLKLDLK